MKQQQLFQKPEFLSNMQLFYTPNLNENDVNFSFDKEESKHIIKVLRKKEGDILFATNGRGILFQIAITAALENHCSVKIVSFEAQEATAYKIHIAVAPTKMNDRIEWFLEKATEMGIQEITPIFCDRSERKQINPARFEKIIISAMKQSGQVFLPKLNEASSFKDFVNTHQNNQKLIAHCEKTVKKSLSAILKPNKSSTILIGPEGDFSEKEIQLALKNNFIAVTLGKTRLRTETAALVACHSIHFFNQTHEERIEKIP